MELRGRKCVIVSFDNVMIVVRNFENISRRGYTRVRVNDRSKIRKITLSRIKGIPAKSWVNYRIPKELV